MKEGLSHWKREVTVNETWISEWERQSLQKYDRTDEPENESYSEEEGVFDAYIE